MRRANDWIDECSLPFPVLLDEFAVEQIKGGEFCPGMVFTVFEVSANSAKVGLPGQTERYRVPRTMMVQITRESASRITVLPVLGHAAEKSPPQFIKLIQPDPNLKLDKVILPPSLQRATHALLDEFQLANNKRFKRIEDSFYKTGASNEPDRILNLFYGASGTGKTLLAKSIASTLEIPCLRLTPSHMSSFVSVSERVMSSCIDLATHCAGGVLLLIDESDGWIRARGAANATDWRDGQVADFLSSLGNDGASTPLIILTTNLSLSQIDPAIITRSRQLKFEAPRPQERTQLLRSLLNPRRVGRSVRWAPIAEESLSLREVAGLVNTAVKMAVKRELSSGNRARKAKVEQTDFLNALQVIRQTSSQSTPRSVGFSAQRGA